MGWHVIEVAIPLFATATNIASQPRSIPSPLEIPTVLIKRTGFIFSGCLYKTRVEGNSWGKGNQINDPESDMAVISIVLTCRQKDTTRVHNISYS